MGCQCDKKDGRIEVILTFRREELLYDIRNIAYVEGDLLGDDQAKLRQMIQDIAEKGNADILTRALNTAHAEIREEFYPFTKEPVPTAEAARPWNDVLTNPEVYILRLSLPETFSATTVNLIERELHDYLVYRGLAEWLDIVSPETAAKWRQKAGGAVEAAKHSLSSRTKPVRLKLHEF